MAGRGRGMTRSRVRRRRRGRHRGRRGGRRGATDRGSGKCTGKSKCKSKDNRNMGCSGPKKGSRFKGAGVGRRRTFALHPFADPSSLPQRYFRVSTCAAEPGTRAILGSQGLGLGLGLGLGPAHGEQTAAQGQDPQAQSQVQDLM